MKKIIKLTLIITISCLTQVVFSAEEAFSCKSYTPKSQDKNIVLNLEKADKPQIFIFQNTSDQSLWLDHPGGKHSANAGWGSYLQTKKWSAIWLDRNNFMISCSVINPGKVDYQNCAKSITVCVPAQASMESKRKGTYWLAENMDWDELTKALEKRAVKDPQQPSSR